MQASAHARSSRAVGCASRAFVKGQRCVVPSELIPCIGRVDRRGSLELVCNPARHQKRYFGVMHTARRQGRLTADQERCDVGRYQASDSSACIGKRPSLSPATVAMGCAGHPTTCLAANPTGLGSRASVFALLNKVRYL